MPRSETRLPAIADLVFAASALAVAGCGTGGTFETVEIGKGHSVVMSADKRAVVVLTGVAGDGGAGRTVVCAEPQPDALRAIAHELAARAEATGGPAGGGEARAQGELSAAAREAIASLGSRTPTVQLMRDTLYRACEGVMNGILKEQHVEFVASRIDNVMIGLHAIDGLTGMAAAPTVAIGTLNAARTTESGTTAEGANVTIQIQGQARQAPAGADLAKIAEEVRKIVEIVILERAN